MALGQWLEDAAVRLTDVLQPVVSLPVDWFAARSHALQDRMVGLALLLPSGTVLGIASWLTPDPSGMGTHTQLGLGGCSVLTITGLPCPMCGMTTTFTHMAHLEVLQALLNQPFGVLLFSLTVAAAAIGLLDLVRPGQRWRKALGWLERRETLAAAVLLVGMFGGWVYKVLLVRQVLPW